MKLNRTSSLLLCVALACACDDTVRYSASPAGAGPASTAPGANPAVRPADDPSTYDDGAREPGPTRGEPGDTTPDREVTAPDGDTDTPALVDQGELSDLRFSADGAVLAYLRAAPLGRSDAILQLYHLASGRGAVVTDRYAGNLDLSPDGKAVIFKNHEGTNWAERENLQIFRWDPDNAGEAATTRRIDTAVDGGSASFSPDGSHVFYTHQQSSHPRLRGWSVATATRLNLNPMVQSDYEFRSFSGTTMAYVVETWRYDGNRRYDTANLHLYNLETGQDRDTGVNLYFDHQVQFSPRGDRIGYQEQTRDENFRTHGKRFHVRDLASDDVHSTEVGIRQLVVAKDLKHAAFQRPDQGQIWPNALVVQSMQTAQLELVTERLDAYPLAFAGTLLLYLTGAPDGPHALHAYDMTTRKTHTIDTAIGLPPGALSADDRKARRESLPVRAVGTRGSDIAFYHDTCAGAGGALRIWRQQTETLIHAIRGHDCQLDPVASNGVLVVEQRSEPMRRLLAWHLVPGNYEEYARTDIGFTTQNAPDGGWTVAQIHEESTLQDGLSRLEAIHWRNDTSRLLFHGIIDEYAVSSHHTAFLERTPSGQKLWVAPLR